MSWTRQLFKDSPFSIAQGEVSGHSGEHKFGAVAAMSTNTTGTIWDVNDTKYPWSSWDTAATIQFPACNASDDGKKVTVVGLDANYNLQTEEHTLDSDGVVASSSTWSRIYRAFVSEGAANVGDVLIQKSSVTVAKITAGYGQTLMAVYTVPNGYTAYMTQMGATVESGGDASVFVYSRLTGEDQFRIKHSFELANSQYTYKFGVPLKFTAKTDIDVQATMRTNNSRATATFDMILVQDGYEHV